MEIEQLDLDEWLKELKPFQIKTIKSLVQKFGEEEAAKRWIESTGPINTATFGGTPSNGKRKNYYKALKSELHKFICVQEDYIDERKKFFNQGELINAAVSAKIAIVIAPVIGLSVSIVLPAVILLLHTISKISINAYCSIHIDDNEK
jgi:hypothetical protein